MKNFKEILEDTTVDYRKNFSKFIKELAKLSKKYGIVIDGEVRYGKIKTINYVDDFSSGDLDSRVTWEE